MLLDVRTQGIVIGQVDLPEERAWAAGLLAPSPGFEAVRALVAAATRDRELALRILTLPLGASPLVDDLEPALARAVLALVAQPFELSDPRGRIVQAEVVRVADPGPREQVLGVRVRAHFRLDPTGNPAISRSTPAAGPGSSARGA